MRSIDPSLLSKINKQNQTIWNGNAPRISIQVSRAKSTVMDATYWTVEEIRTKAGLGDLSVAARRQVPYGSPDKLFNVYVDNGVVKTSTRSYPDYEEKKWQDQFELGSGTACAIAFDGYWDLYRNKWQMVTSENPWCFWVNGGMLYAQYWDDAATKLNLATTVSKVKAIRAWVNINIVDQDQGVVAGYIKTDGKVYYRNYCRQADGTYAWEAEKEIAGFIGTAANLNLFITNDYRMGFAIEDSTGKIHLHITARAWAGMAITPDRVSVAPGEIKASFIPVEYIDGIETEYLSAAPEEISAALLYALTNNAIVSVINTPVTKVNDLGEEYQDWGWAIEFEVVNAMPNLELSQVTFTDLDTVTPIGISSIEKINDNKYKANVDPIAEAGINNVFGDIKLTITGALNPAGYAYQTISKDFTPINLVPKAIPLPVVLEVWNE